MIHPSYSELMKAINSEHDANEAPLVNSRYSIVLATSKRARQIISGAEPLVKAAGKKPLSIAVEEMYEGKVKILPEGTQEEDQEEE
ncbi:MAG: DNA-directed RNA polymerase subunit omega [Ruminococcus sp.]|jgi:DNA-directed RNA polymerase subunit omega